MFCTQCGNQIIDQAKFCPACGAKIHDEISTAIPQPPASTIPIGDEQIPTQTARHPETVAPNATKVFGIFACCLIALGIIFYVYTGRIPSLAKLSGTMSQITAPAASAVTASNAPAADKPVARTYPYLAVVSCGMMGHNINVLACFSDHSGGTQIELRNGSQYGLYRLYEFNRLGHVTQRGLEIRLADHFELKAQNADEHLTLGVKITDLESDKVVYEKQVAQYGVVSVSN